MNTFKKISLTALGSTLIATSAFAGAMSVTGSAGINFFGEEKADTNNGWSMTDEVTFSGGGEMDNGWNVTVSMQLDSSETATGNMDNRSVAIDMGDSGTLTFYGHGGDGALSAIDDKMPTAYEESWDVVSGASLAVGGPSSNNMFRYSNSTAVDNVTIVASYSPSGDTTEDEGSTDFGITYTGIENLTVGAATGEDKGDSTSNAESTNMYVTYVFDSFTIGAQSASLDSEAANGDRDFTAYGVSYAVSEDLSLSYGMSTIDFENTAKEDQEATGISFSYTMGSMTLAGAHNTVDNVAGTSASDNSGYEVDLSFAF
jgi:outer membrane protein OmpU